MALKDKTLTCRDCGQEFTFTVGEQEFYASRGLLNEPRRCPECRAAQRRERGGGGYGGSRGSYSAICAACGVETTVPFEPTEGRPVYCRECYAKIKQEGGLGSKKS
ncbi:MAG TPA: zinc-binding protein [Dehalococcoidia bacterium]|jgi:CxxC-x17-CxxC domain-containing protein|nr:zinc-binding protein [Dehalococcoidia bacterium]